ncbi:MAG: hypothetical protein Q7R57_00965 [Dehalococcoidales bacterium]|nr:hypothetical protein [Dehalococcoidales bacterium]
MVTDRTQKRLPPYVSYRTFRNFVEGLQQGIPARIDRSYWGDNLSGSTGTQLVAALRFLGLVDADSLPTSRLKMLVFAKGNQRGDVLKQISTESYSFLGAGTIDMQIATYAQLDEVFKNSYQLTSDVGRKCTKFFIGLASDAEIPLSPFILKRSKTIHSNISPKTPRKLHKGTTKGLGIPEEVEIAPERTSWDKILITKFPTFDPSWPDEIKVKWFDGFDQLMKRGLSLGKE